MSRGFDEALGRARTHLQQAFLEGLEAAMALLEAASVVRSDPKADGSLVGEIARGLDRAIRELRAAGNIDLPPGLLEPVEKALDLEIARWEERSKRDRDARPVLRAFLGLRELLFEITRSNPAPAETEAADSGRREKASGPRVQRFDVES